MTGPRSEPAGPQPALDLDVTTIPTLKAAHSQPATSADATRLKPVQPVPPQQPAADALSDAQVLKVLEQRRSGPAPLDGEAVGSEIDVLPPEDTGTRLVLRDAVARNSPVSFAVQLQWSVHAIDVKSVPPHPIFSAYTLYAAEGRRGGRAWFFLRLGFFSDAVAAKQVAHFLRSHFASAAVVPVSPLEREHAVRIGRYPQAATIARSPVSMNK